MKTKAKKASSDSENIQVAYFVFDRSELLHLQWTPMCGELLCGFVSYEVFACITDVVGYWDRLPVYQWPKRSQYIIGCSRLF